MLFQVKASSSLVHPPPHLHRNGRVHLGTHTASETLALMSHMSHTIWAVLVSPGAIVMHASLVCVAAKGTHSTFGDLYDSG